MSTSNYIGQCDVKRKRHLDKIYILVMKIRFEISVERALNQSAITEHQRFISHVILQTVALALILSIFVLAQGFYIN